LLDSSFLYKIPSRIFLYFYSLYFFTFRDTSSSLLFKTFIFDYYRLDWSIYYVLYFKGVLSFIISFKYLGVNTEDEDDDDVWFYYFEIIYYCSIVDDFISDFLNEDFGGDF
jgi:hypothetical protein